MKVWSWGIIGTGRISSDFAMCLSFVKIAVAGSDSDRAILFAKKHDIPKSYGTYEGLAGDPEVEIVYVGLMNHLHETATVIASNMGKAVLCEKPFSNNYESAKRMVETARMNGKFLMEAMWTRYFPITNDIRNFLASRLIGDVHAIVCNIGCIPSKSPRMSFKKYGASSLYDMGVYAVAYASMVFGPNYPESVQSVGRMHPVENFDVDVSALLKYKNGVAVIHCSIESFLAPHLTILGKKGRIECRDFWCPTEFSLFLNDGTSKTFDAYTNPEYQLPFDNNVYNCKRSEGLHYEAAYAQKLLEEGKLESDKLSLDESLTIMKILQTIATQIGL